jgi:hypothetical protein
MIPLLPLCHLLQIIRRAAAEVSAHCVMYIPAVVDLCEESFLASEPLLRLLLLLQFPARSQSCVARVATAARRTEQETDACPLMRSRPATPD